MLKNLFSGNLDRSQFLLRYLLSIFTFIFLTGAFLSLSKNNTSLQNSQMLGVIFIFLIILIYQLTVYVRRLRDAGQSPFWALLIFFIPVNPLFLILLLLIPSKQTELTPEISPKHKKVLFFGNIFLIILVTFGIYLMIFTDIFFNPNSQPPANTLTGITLSPTPTPKLKSSLIIFMDSLGKIMISFKDSDEITEQQDGSYLLDKMNKKLYFTYYPSKNNLLPKLNTHKDSDGNNAGQGCFLSEDKINIADYEFQKQYCYYNPINLTKSGDYDIKISSINQTNCIGFLNRVNNSISALKISGEGSLGSDYCQDFGQLTDLKIELNDPFVLSKESLVGIWHGCPMMPDNWCDHYNFYSSGKYSYYPEIICTMDGYKESGTWSYQNNILELQTITHTVLEDGISYPNANCPDKKMIIYESAKEVLLSTPKTNKFEIVVIDKSMKSKINIGGGKEIEEIINPKEIWWYTGILLKQQGFWKFSDDPTTYYEKNEFPEPTGF